MTTKKVGHVAKDDVYINTVDLKAPAEHLQIAVHDYTGQHVATVHVIGASTFLQLYSANGYEVSVEQQPMPTVGIFPPVNEVDNTDPDGEPLQEILAIDVWRRLDELERRVGVLDSHTHVITPALNPYATGGPIARNVTDERVVCTCPSWSNPAWPHRHGCPAAATQTSVVSGGDQLG